MAILIDGKVLAEKIRRNLKIECDELKSKGIKPKLAVIMVGENSASKIYVKNKIQIHPAGEWLLDNFYVIEEVVRSIEKEMTLKKYKNFVGLSNR